MQIKKFINIKDSKDVIEFNFTMGEFSWDKKKRPAAYNEYVSNDGDKLSVYWGDDGYSPVGYWD